MERSQEQHPDHSAPTDAARRPVPRPWAAVAAALVAGSWSGGAVASALDGAGRAVLVGLLVAAALALAGRARRCSPSEPARVAAALFAVAALGAWPSGAGAPASLVPDRAAIGRYEDSGYGRGRLIGDAGRVLDVRLAARGPAPEHGSRVALLPPFEVRPRARGPVAPPVRPPPGDLVLAPDQIVVLARARGPGPIARAVADRRADLAERAQRLPTPAGRGRSGLAPALLVGDRSALDRDVGDLFTRTGTRHLLALSGLHVGLFALLVVWPSMRAVRALVARLLTTGRSPWPRRVGALVAAVQVVAFAALAGASPPIVRASVVAVLVLAAHEWPRGGPRRCDAFGLLSLALALELVPDAESWRDATVALSFGASLALAAAARPASDLVSRALFGRGTNARLEPLVWLGSRPRIALGVLRLRLERATSWALGTSIVANIGTLPALWIVFGEFAPVGLVATPVVAPLLLAWLPSLWLAALAPDTWLARPQAWVEGAMLWLLERFDALGGTAVLLPERPGWWIALASFAALVVLARPRARWCSLLAQATALAWALTLVPWTTAPARLEVTALDVGHGTCAVVRAPGLGLIVFDAGSTTHNGLDRDALRPLLARLDPAPGLLVLSHTDADHRSALGWLATRLRWRRIAGAWPSGLEAPAPRDLLATAPTALVRTGARAAIGGPSARWTLLRGSTGPGNGGSYDLVVEWAGVCVLLFGDGTDGGLARLVRRGLVPRQVDLALLPHHGGFGVGVEAWLDVARTRELWISAGAPADLEPELDRRDICWRSTWSAGPLERSFEPRAGPRAGPFGARVDARD